MVYITHNNIKIYKELDSILKKNDIQELLLLISAYRTHF